MSTATYPIFSDGGNGATLDTGNGFIDYNNTGAPITLVANTWTTITNDGLGLSTNKAYAPKGVTELMDVSTGAFDFTELEKGDGVYIRNDFTVVPSTNNALVEVRYLLSAGAECLRTGKDSCNFISWQWPAIPTHRNGCRLYLHGRPGHSWQPCYVASSP